MRLVASVCRADTVDARVPTAAANDDGIEVPGRAGRVLESIREAAIIERVIRIVDPLPDIASHVVDAERAGANGVTPDPGGIAHTGRAAADPVIGVEAIGVIPPGVFAFICAAGGLLPLRFGRQARAAPLFAIRDRHIPVHENDRIIIEIGSRVIVRVKR